MSLATLIVENARLHGSRAAILDEEGGFTWAQFAGRVARAAGLLAAQGLRPGDRYAIVLRNGFRCAELLWAGYWTGIIPVPINWRLSALEIAAILEDADARIVFAAREFAPRFAESTLERWGERVLPVEAAGEPGEYEALLATAAPAPLRECDENDDAILLYTGGTTGRSKGVRLTHRNILADGWQNAVALGIRPDDVYLHVAPMFHSADMNATACYMLACGHAYLAQFTPAGIFAAIAGHRVTVTNLVPTMIKLMADAPEAAQCDLSSLRLIYYGSSPMPLEWLQAARGRFPGVGWYQGYGLTETAPILTTMDERMHERCFASGDFERLKSVGTPVVGVQLRIVDHADRELPPGETGEVVVRGPNVSPGYFNRPEENARGFRGGWFHTGDVGRLDADGYLTLVDRTKDVIISGGENVYSTEVEAALYRHPDIAEAAVIGVPDATLGEAVFAVICCKWGKTLRAEDVVAHCRAYIGGYKAPKKMVFVDALPRTALGKVQKSVLREKFASAR
ncbi:MAG: AMP-binding protein [Burkholderiales bacterium]|nr:AMP-binding protein [Burkholderiales bacterium]